MNEQESLFEWFEQNRENIIANHYGECAAIAEKEVKGYFPDSHSAIEAMSKKYGQERFIVQDCLPLEEYTMHYYTGIFSFV